MFDNGISMKQLKPMLFGSCIKKAFACLAFDKIAHLFLQKKRIKQQQHQIAKFASVMHVIW